MNPFYKKLLFLLLSLNCLVQIHCVGQPVNELFEKLKKKINAIDNYEADALMKTNVSFLKVPAANVKIYFQKPNQVKIKNEQGISFVPKGIMNMNLSSIINGNNYMVIDAGTEIIKNINVRILKLLPIANHDDGLVLATIYVNEKDLLILKTETTTKENGTYQLELSYGKYSKYGLPDHLVFSFNTKDYKLPKGITFDFDDGSNTKKTLEKKQGNMDITFKNYTINKGIPSNVFK